MTNKQTPGYAALNAYLGCEWHGPDALLNVKYWDEIARAAISAYIAQLGPGEMVYNPNAGPLFPESEDGE